MDYHLSLRMRPEHLYGQVIRPERIWHGFVEVRRNMTPGVQTTWELGEAWEYGGDHYRRADPRDERLIHITLLASEYRRREIEWQWNDSRRFPPHSERELVPAM